MSVGKIPHIKTIMYISVLIGIIFVIYTVYTTYFKTNNEHFAGFYDENTKFAKSQTNFFGNKMNKALDYDTNLEKTMPYTNAALVTVAPEYQEKKNLSIPSFLNKDPLPGKKKETEVCSLIKEPRYLPARDPITQTGCGWWFVEDPLKDSTATIGSSSGPDDTRISDNFPGGSWIWDLEKAQKLEDAKKCKAVKICDQADIFPRECGFCPSSNSGVPVNKYGKNKYPDDPNLNCQDVITKPELCPKNSYDNTSISDPVNGKLSTEYLISLAIAAGCTSEGVLIKILSTGNFTKYLTDPGDDSELFTIANKALDLEENIPLKLEFYGKGQCEKAEAIKYYRSLRKAATSSKSANARAAAEYITRGTEYDPCMYSDKTKGPFSLLCLKRVALENNCQSDGTDFPSTVPYKPRGIPKKCGNLGRPSNDGELRLYSVDECRVLKGTYNGDSECISAEGLRYNEACKSVNDLANPPMSTKSIYDKMTWANVNLHFKNLYSMMNSSTKEIQASATKRCLGIEIIPPKSGCDNIDGCEILWYLWDYDYKIPERKIPVGTFLGREIKKTLPKFNDNAGTGSYNPYNINRNISFRIRTKYLPNESKVKKIGIVNTDGICVKIDDKTVIQNWIAGAQKALESERILFRNTEPKNLDIYWFKGEDRATFIPKISVNGNSESAGDFLPNELSLHVPTSYPLARWDFYNETDIERNSVLISENSNFSYGQKDGKKCANFSSASSCVLIKNNIAGTAFKSFTYKVYIESVPGGWCRLFSLRKSPTGCDGGYIFENSTAMEGGLNADGSIWMALKQERGNFFIWNQSLPSTYKINTWCHISFVFDDDLKGSTIYFNGEIVGRKRDEDCPADLFLNTIYNNNAIGLGHYNKECNAQPIYCGLAWAHWFDYTLDKESVRKDNISAFTKKELYPENTGTGWRL